MGEEALGKQLEFGGDKITGRKWNGREKNLWAYTFLPEFLATTGLFTVSII